MRSKGLEFGANESYNQLKRLRKFTVVFTGPEICRRVLPCRGGVLQSLDTATPQAPPTTFPQRHLRHHQPRSHSDTSGTTNHVPRDTATPQAPPTTFPQRHLRNQPRSQGHSDTSGTTNHVGGWWLVVSEGWWLVVSEGHLCLGTSDTTNQRCPGSASLDTQLAQAPLIARKRGGRRLLRHRYTTGRSLSAHLPAGRPALGDVGTGRHVRVQPRRPVGSGWRSERAGRRRPTPQLPLPRHATRFRPFPGPGRSRPAGARAP